MSRAELYAEVARFQQFLIASGVGEGDRVAGYLPNLPETLVAMLATVSLGAIWSSASPDFGVQGVLDRFGQIEPKVLICVDGYWYNGKAGRLPGEKRRNRRPNALAAQDGGRALSGGDAGCRQDCQCRALARDQGVRGAVDGQKDVIFSVSASITRSSSCSPAARPACPNASSIATAGCCCSI
jgi:acyl-coenzyme A synthetase/AMP-(fatty) acid ligase